MQTNLSQSIRPRKKKRNWQLFWILLPMLILVVMFHYVPLAGWALSLFEYKPGYPLLQNKFIGLKYFR